MVFKGKAAKPTYAYIHDGQLELLDAKEVWGKSVHETVKFFKNKYGEKDLTVITIGPAGENLVKFALILTSSARSGAKKGIAGRCGMGAVMGSKNLKAVAVRGTRTDAYQLANPEAFFAATEAGKKALAANGVTGQGLPTYGTQVLMNVINEMGALPTRNFRDGSFEGAKAISGQTMRDTILVNRGTCFACAVALEPEQRRIRRKAAQLSGRM